MYSIEVWISPTSQRSLFGPSSAAFRSHLTGGFDRTLIQGPFACICTCGNRPVYRTNPCWFGAGICHFDANDSSSVYQNHTKDTSSTDRGLNPECCWFIVQTQACLAGDMCRSSHWYLPPQNTNKGVEDTFFFLTLPFYFSRCMFLPHKSKREKLITAGLAEDKPLLM